MTSAFSDAKVAQMRSPRDFATTGALALLKKTTGVMGWPGDLRDMTTYTSGQSIYHNIHFINILWFKKCNGIIHIYYDMNDVDNCDIYIDYQCIATVLIWASNYV